MSDENKVGTYPFVAEPFHVDFMERLTMGVLGNHLLNCAGFHAAERGFGIATLNENHYTWVLSRLAIEMKEYPTAFDKIQCADVGGECLPSVYGQKLCHPQPGGKAHRLRPFHLGDDQHGNP